MLRRPPTQLTLTRDDIRAYVSRRAERAQHSTTAPAPASFTSASTATAAQRPRGPVNGWAGAFTAPSRPTTRFDGEEEEEDGHDEHDLDASIPDADADESPTEPDETSDVDMDDDTFDGRGARGAGVPAPFGSGGGRRDRIRPPQFAQPRAPRPEEEGPSESVAAQRRRRIVGEEASRAVRAPGVPRRMGGER